MEKVRTGGESPPAAVPSAHSPLSGLQPRHLPTTRRLLAVTLFSVIFVETGVMLLLHWTGPLFPLASAVFDSLFLAFLLFPLLLYLVFKPLETRVRAMGQRVTDLESSREAYRALIDSAEDSIYLVDDRYRYLFINVPHAARLGLPAESYIGRAYGEFHSPEKTLEFEAAVDRVIRDGRSVRHEHLSRRDGRFFLMTFSPVRDRGGRAVAVTVVSKDITALKNLEDRLQTLSCTDELTGLLNRRGFGGLAEHRLRLAERQGADVALLYADMDNLKVINDRFGHQAGDRAIRDTAMVLKEVCRESDILARVGGDEFVVLLAESSPRAVERVRERVRQETEKYNACSSAGLSLSLSIGVGRCAAGSPCSIEELISRADESMYEEKSRRRDAPTP